MDDVYPGFTLDSLRDWIDAHSRRGRADLGDTGLPPQLRDAWLPVGMDFYPRGSQNYAILDAAGEVEISYHAQIYTQAGEAGRLGRHFSTTTGIAKHKYFSLPASEWGGGNGKRMMRRSAELYRRLGLSEIQVDAVDLGRYLWGALRVPESGRGNPPRDAPGDPQLCGPARLSTRRL